MKYPEKLQKVLQQMAQDVENFNKKEIEFIEEFKKSKISLPLAENFLSEVGSLTDSFKKGLDEVKEVVEKIEEDYSVSDEDYRTLEEQGKSTLSLRFEIASTLEDLTKYIPDILLRENLEIFSRILRDEEKLIRADSIFLLFKKSA